MSEVSHSSRLISHDGQPRVTFSQAIDVIKARLRTGADVPGATLEQQFDLVDKLAEFELGRFLLLNRGLNAYWTHRLVTHETGSFPPGAVSELERTVFDSMPAVLATRERFDIFRRELQALLRPGIVVASVPCGWMGDLLQLQYASCPDVTLLGVDLDQDALDGARALAAERGLESRLSLHCTDAWSMNLTQAAHVLTSNGLNIYEPDDSRVIELYQRFFDVLKPGGRLVTSFLTPPPSLSDQSPWDMSAVSPVSLAMQHLLFVRVIEVKWSAFRTHAQTCEHLKRAGFTDIRFVDDRARIFPTVIARKPD